MAFAHQAGSLSRVQSLCNSPAGEVTQALRGGSPHMRRLHALWAVAGAAGLLAGAIAPATAGPRSPVTAPRATSTPDVTGSGATSTQTITLITGDTVSVTTGPDGK